MKTVFVICALVLSAFLMEAQPQETRTKNIIVVTLDGYRWQELFEGADKRVLNNKKYIKDPSVKEQFGNAPANIRREKLMPFFWNVIGTQGQLYGNRNFKNKVNCSNIHLISYPGYSEMLVGFADNAIHSNSKIVNPNPTVLEFIHKHDDYKNEVVAFATWDAFPFILREKESAIPVNAGNDKAEGNISDAEKAINDEQASNKNPYGSRYDDYTFQFAFEYLKREKPRVMFLGFDETDEHAHGGRYDEYLKSAHKADRMIGELWSWMQSQDEYRDQTTLFITTDHGRGRGKNSWRKHQLVAPGSGQIWFAVLGPDTPAFGEMKMKAKYRQKQVAKTIAAFLGLQYEHRLPVGEVVQTMIASPMPDPFTGKPSASERN